MIPARLAGLLFVILIAGCTARAGRAPAPPVPAATEIDKDELLRAIAIRRTQIHGLRALARADYSSPQESYRARQMILLAKRPDRLRWEILSPFGTAFVLTAADGIITAYAPGEDTIYRGTASPENLARYAGVDLSVPLAVDLLLGTPPLQEGGLTVASRDGENTKIWQSLNGIVTACWFNDSLDPVRFELQDESGYVLVDATFGGYEEIGGIRMPARLTLEIPATSQRIDIELRDREPNPELADGLFELQPPPGVKEIDIDRVPN